VIDRPDDFVCAAIIALFTAFDSLLNLVSVCTLFTFYVVAMGVLYRHYHLPGKTKPWLALFVMFWFTATSLGARDYSHTIPSVRSVTVA
jgi:amino acid transporter